jgi:dynein heavy chain
MTTFTTSQAPPISRTEIIPIVRLLATTTGSLIDDEYLVNTLKQSKSTSEEVTSQLALAEETEKKIDVSRLG